MVFRRSLRNNLRLRPINRIKHVVDLQGATALGVNTDIEIANATDTPTLAATDSVETGCTINGVFIVLEVSLFSGSALPNVYFALYKNPGDNLVMPSPNIVGASDNKRFVIHQEMVMLDGDNAASIPRTLFKGVVVIPRGYRRFGPDDRLFIKILSPGRIVNFCFQAHYKEFR